MNPQNKAIINPGDRFGSWTVIKEAKPKIVITKTRNLSKRVIECQCECGVVKLVELVGLISGRTKSCGCSMKKPRKRIPVIPGTKINKLTIIQEVPKKGQDRRVLCECECGTIKEMPFLKLNKGETISCGCYCREEARKPKLNKRSENHPYMNTRLYSIWCGIRRRCYSQKSHAYKWYGAKGVRMCKEWEQRFLNFYEWAIANGYSDNLSIERIDSAKNYEPSNCKWIPLSQQNSNKRISRYIEYRGEKMSIKYASEKFGIPYVTIIGRLNKGWSGNEVIEKSAQSKL